jgi:hypothetical protein
MGDLVTMAEDTAPNKKITSHDIKLGIRNSFASPAIRRSSRWGTTPALASGATPTR